jgi:hypothetical protein
MNVLGLDLFFLDERRRFRKFRPSTVVLVDSGLMLLIFLFIRLAMIFSNIFNNNMDNVYTFVAKIKSSKQAILCSCFLFRRICLGVKL